MVEGKRITDEKTKKTILAIHYLLQELPNERALYVLRRLNNVYSAVSRLTEGKQSKGLNESSEITTTEPAS